MTGRARLRWVIGIALLTVLLTTLPGHAAESFALLACDTKAELTYTAAGGGVFNWTLDPPSSGPLGTCTYQGSGTLQFTSFHGDGTSHGLGMCSGNPLVTDFTMAFDFRVEGDVVTPGVGTVHRVITAINQPWTGLPSAYPSAIAFTQPGFFFVESGAPLGHGVLTSRIYSMCPPKGSSRARVTFDLPIAG